MRILLAVILTLSVAGCGTMANLEGQQYAFLSPPGFKPVRVYGGVRNDFDWVYAGFNDSETDGDAQDNSDRLSTQILEDPISVAGGMTALGYFAVVDPVLSFVADTITLPYVIGVLQESADESSVDVAQHPQIESDP
ncbi:hypothetical protein CA54_09780 [Symmachiella macrocystis]|uniref:YceK/YidQ family lipoprotein n=1 Tax=Symmachiella macrocystis TaxID=2527985 RepID=A0A5C6BJG8_9PLAN|nr:YceK/YidQ family lipoprotein [Symmachiella macrocystis]TWU12160.1 hypothetical protein CA54_09780 [Symmachiella macrocystis]